MVAPPPHTWRVSGGRGGTTECREVPGPDGMAGSLIHASGGSSPFTSASQFVRPLVPVVVHQDDLGPHFTLMLSEPLRQVQLLKIAFIVTKGRTQCLWLQGKERPILPGMLTRLNQESSAQLTAGRGQSCSWRRLRAHPSNYTHTVFISDSGRVTTNYQPP